MNIAVLTKRRWGLYATFEALARRRGHTITAFDLTNLVIDDNFRRFDLVVLKSKQLFFVYAGYQAQAMGIPVIPDPEICRQVSTRIEFPFLARRAGIATPDYYFAAPQTLRTQLTPGDFPLVRKRIVGSGSAGVELVRTLADLPETNDQQLYLEQYVVGQHLLVYFIDDAIRVFEKQAFVSGREPVRPVDLTEDVAGAVRLWRGETGLRFGHLDFVREAHTRELVLVDPGAFPQFWHWPGAAERVSSIILEHLP